MVRCIFLATPARWPSHRHKIPLARKSRKTTKKTAKKTAQKASAKAGPGSKTPGANRAPRPLALRRHLDTCTVAELEEFYKFWNPHQKNGRLAREKLIEKLYRVMSDENVRAG